MHTPNNARTALVLGATGGIGGEVARQLLDDGWVVRALTRRTMGIDAASGGIQWIKGDAMHTDEVVSAADGCAVIVHAVNPPGYRHWGEQVLPMINNTIAAAVGTGRTIVLPGTLYNFGPDVFPLVHEDAAQNPVTKKGAIRVELERRLEAATHAGAKALIVRAGDFFGPKAGNSWLSPAVVKPHKPLRTIRVPSGRGVGHQWAYLPDVAHTMVQLLGRRQDLPPFFRVHTRGHWDEDGTRMASTIERIAARHGIYPTRKAFPWWALPLVAPFAPKVRELLELKYLWHAPVSMANDILVDILGEEPHTPWSEAVEKTLIGLGCIPKSPQASSATV